MNKMLDGRLPRALIVCAFPRLIRGDGHPANRTWMAAEFEELARSAGFSAIETLSFNHGRINPALYLGSGQMEKIACAAEEIEPDAVLTNLNLSPVHQQNWREKTSTTVLTRSNVIFDIFERNAHSSEGKLQVEIARLRYDLPRVMHIFEEQSGARGGIGQRGLGEKLHLKTKREIERRIHALGKRLDKVKRDRALRRARRERSMLPLVSLVGYTNAGKSSLLNVFTGSSALVDDRYFATLNPTVRRLKLPGGSEVLMGDTVGFIEDLPRELIAAFQATLEELELTDLIVHVVDLARPDAGKTAESVIGIIEKLGLVHVPRVTLLNKSDALADPEDALVLEKENEPAIRVSALERNNILPALKLIERMVFGKVETADNRARAAYPYE